MRGSVFCRVWWSLSLLLTLVGAGLTPAAADEGERKWIFIPVISYMPETGFMFGASGILFFHPDSSCHDCRPSRIQPLAIYTTKKQFIAMVKGTRYWSGNRNRFSGKVYYREFPDLYFGIGPETLQEDREGFTPRISGLDLALERKLWTDLSLGLSGMVESVSMVKVEATGALATGRVVGSKGGGLQGLGVHLKYDTRDSEIYPRRGISLLGSARRFGGALGGEFQYDLFKLQGAGYWRVVGGRVLALQALGEYADGIPPFYHLMELGDERGLRGFESSRYRDNCRSLMQVEYRMPSVAGPLGLALFAGMGNVGPTPGELRLDQVHRSAGIGFRYQVDPEVEMNLRLDLVYGDEGFTLYMALGETF